MDKLHNLSGELEPSPLMPVLFVGHGNPMNAISDNEFTRTWGTIGEQLPDAQAIVVISAHWLTTGTHITNAPKNKIIYDFYGFPEELYNVQYDAYGSPEIAQQLHYSFLKYEAELDNQWGLDHGTWSVLKHLAPEPQVPVLQISLDQNMSLPEIMKLFSELRPLRQKGVIFIGSGNIVHGLQFVRFDSKPYDWALEFDAVSTKAISEKRINDLVAPRKFGTASQFAVPTDEHYRPMLAIMSLLEPREQIDYFNAAIDLGSIGMRSFISKQP